MPQHSAEPPAAKATSERPSQPLREPRGLAEWMRLIHHELGNQLAAVRMAAELVGVADPGEVTPMIERATVSAATLLAQAEPLLHPSPLGAEALVAETLLWNAVVCARAQGASDPRVCIDAAPRLIAPAERAEQALVALLLTAPGTAELHAHSTGLRTLVAIGDTGPPVAADWASLRAPQGRALLLQLVAEGLAPFDISVESVSADPGNRIILSFRSAPGHGAPSGPASDQRPVEPAGGDPA